MKRQNVGETKDPFVSFIFLGIYEIFRALIIISIFEISRVHVCSVCVRFPADVQPRLRKIHLKLKRKVSRCGEGCSEILAKNTGTKRDKFFFVPVKRGEEKKFFFFFPFFFFPPPLFGFSIEK